MTALACYLLREDGEWYVLGEHHRWGTAFAVFNGPSDGSVHLALSDVHVLALRLDDYGHDLQTRERIAEDIVRWCQRPEKPRHWATNPAYSVRFLTELDPEVPVDELPAPITGSLQVGRQPHDR